MKVSLEGCLMDKVDKQFINFCYMEIKTMNDLGARPTREDIPNIYKRVTSRFKDDPAPFTTDQIKNLNKEKIIEFLETKIITAVDKTLKLVNNDTNHEAWLLNQDTSKWFFSKRFETYLSLKHEFGPTTTSDIFESADEILAELELPERPGPWRRQGLVFGNVQSGKTSNYSALINKAADAGYKYIIVLAGLNKNLRAQTQIALEENFTGVQTQEEIDSSTGHVGVGNIANFSEKDLKVNVFTTRADNGDFKKKDISKFENINLLPNAPNLFVIKKMHTL